MLATAEKTTLITPYGGTLVDLMVPEADKAELRAYANTLPSIRISERAVCDLELLATGGFSPLDRFMSQADHQSVLDTMRLTNGYLFPIPVPLPVDEEDAAQLKIGGDIALRSPANELLAILNVEEVYAWDLEEVAQKAFGTLDLRHPIVAEMHNWGKYLSLIHI